MSAEAQEIPFSIIRRPGLRRTALTRPKVLVGVNAASQNLEQAQALAATFFGRDVQENYYNDGMTVRADCLAEKLDAVLHNEGYDPAVFYRRPARAAGRLHDAGSRCRQCCATALCSMPAL